MIDSDGKLGPGLLLGSFNLLGNFEECISVKATNKAYPLLPGVHDFDADACRVYYPIIEEFVSYNCKREKHCCIERMAVVVRK